MLIDQGLSGVSQQEFRDYEQPDIFFAVKSFLQDVAPVTISGQFHNASPCKSYSRV